MKKTGLSKLVMHATVRLCAVMPQTWAVDGCCLDGSGSTKTEEVVDTCVALPPIAVSVLFEPMTTCLEGKLQTIITTPCLLLWKSGMFGSNLFGMVIDFLFGGQCNSCGGVSVQSVEESLTTKPQPFAHVCSSKTKAQTDASG